MTTLKKGRDGIPRKGESPRGLSAKLDHRKKVRRVGRKGHRAAKRKSKREASALVVKEERGHIGVRRQSLGSHRHVYDEGGTMVVQRGERLFAWHRL